MGTRGHIFIRCRGRYFVYYNQFDSYPEGLGEAIVATIPVDPEEYRKWLESMREIFSRLVMEFEEHHLPITLETGENGEHVEDGEDGPKSSRISMSELYSKCYLAVDDRLELAPLKTMSRDHLNNLFIEFTYTLDLDREVFSVDDAAHFQLSKIPRGFRWIEYLDIDSSGRRILAPDTPKDVVGIIEWKPDVGEKSCTFPENTNIQVITPRTSISATWAPKQRLLLTTFQAIRHAYREILDRFILSWRPDDFSFREIAFALLSLAAGEISFECPKTLDKSLSKVESYYLAPDRRFQSSQRAFLPAFLGESHLPGVESGSAPKETIFSFGHVLISLTTRLDLVDVKEVSVAEIVNIGLDQGLTNFHALVFSILDFVLVQVKVEKNGSVHIERSPLMSLFHFNDETSHYALGPRSRSKFKGSGLSLDHSSFIALTHFFEAAANQSVVGTKSSIFPNEILAIIMRFSDAQTYHTLAKVSSFCRRMASTRFRFSRDYVVIDVDKEHDHFILEDMYLGKRIQSVLSPNVRERFDLHLDPNKDELELNPIIGVTSVKRASIMDSIALLFSNIKPKDPFCEKFIRFPQLSRFSWDDQANVDDVLNILDYMYPGQVSEGWSRYIFSVLKEEKHFIRARVTDVDYPCLVLPRYRQLKAEEFNYLITLRVFVRHAREETPDEWVKMQEYAVRELARKEAVRHDRLVSRDESLGAVAILVFGARFKLFYYAWHDPIPPAVSPATNNPYSKRIAASITDPDPMHRMILLIPEESGPFDVHNVEERAELERWVGLVRESNYMNKTIYNPVIDEHVLVTKKNKE